MSAINHEAGALCVASLDMNVADNANIDYQSQILPFTVLFDFIMQHFKHPLWLSNHISLPGLTTATFLLFFLFIVGPASAL